VKAKKPKRLPVGNCYWKQIGKDDLVVDNGNAWVVRRKAGGKATVYWMGEEAGEAHRFLSRRAKKDADPNRVWWFNLTKAPAKSRRAKR
jgi:hypothetical protein